MQVTSNQLTSRRVTITLDPGDVVAVDNALRTVDRFTGKGAVFSLPDNELDDLLFVKQLLQQMLGITTR